MKKNLFLVFIAAFCLSMSSWGQGGSRTVSIIPTGDLNLWSNGSNWGDWQAAHRVGGAKTNIDGASVHPFELPALNPREYVGAAQFSIKLNRVAWNPQGNVDLYAIPYRSTSAIVAGDYYQGDYGADPTSTPLQDDFAVQSTGAGTLSTSGSGSLNLLNFIKAQYDGGAQGGEYVFIRLNPDAANVTDYYFWEFASENSSDDPILELEILDPTVLGVTIDQSGPITLTLGETINLSASVAPAHAENKGITWESDAPGVASVNSSGLVTGLTGGQAVITVTSAEGGFTDQITINVECPNIQTPTGLSASKLNGEVALFWNPVEGVTDYKIKYSTAAGEPYEGFLDVPGGSTDHAVVPGLANGTTYYFVIVGVSNVICISNNSSEVSATPTSPINEFIGPNFTITSPNDLGFGLRASRIMNHPNLMGGFGMKIQPVNFLIDIEAPNAAPDLNACLTISYSDVNVPDGLNQATLDLYRFDVGNNTWVKMDGALDVNNKKVTLCGINEFSQWTIAGSNPQAIPLENWGIAIVLLIAAGIILIRKI